METDWFQLIGDTQCRQLSPFPVPVPVLLQLGTQGTGAIKDKLLKK